MKLNKKSVGILSVVSSATIGCGFIVKRLISKNGCKSAELETSEVLKEEAIHIVSMMTRFYGKSGIGISLFMRKNPDAVLDRSRLNVISNVIAAISCEKRIDEIMLNKDAAATIKLYVNELIKPLLVSGNNLVNCEEKEKDILTIHFCTLNYAMRFLGPEEAEVCHRVIEDLRIN